MATGPLPDLARALFAAACRAADPALALEAALAAHPLPRPDAGGHRIVIALGKAALPMARAVMPGLDPADPVLVVTNYENAGTLAGARVIAAGHPVPDDNGAAAACEVEALLDAAGAHDRVVVLVSGGGSALLPAPATGLTLEDKQKVNRLLLANGFEIAEINLVRQQLSRLKGGGMLRHAAPAPVTAYVLSDVIGDDLRVIASGPTVAPVGSRADARALLRSRSVWDHLPEAAQQRLVRDDPAMPAPPAAENILVGSNRQSLEAAAAAAISAGIEPEIVSDRLTGDVADAAQRIIAAARSTAAGKHRCLIFGGETTVTLRGDGLGGRNQELALRVALAMPDPGCDWCFLSGGTDGRDGPTEAAGGLVDAGTADRIRASGQDPLALLARNDSNRALAAAGDLLVTGATGTNVADVQILLLSA